MDAPLLNVNNATIRFGGLTAISGLTFHLKAGELLGLIGPNGAGKTTVFNIITGVYQPTEGSVEFKDHRLNGLKPHDITRLGIARTFQNIRLFSSLSVLENVMTAAALRQKSTLLDAVLKTQFAVAEKERLRQEAMNLLHAFNLAELADNISKDLPYGKQRRLEIARALATKPELLLLDEPAAGMNPQESAELMKLILRLKDEFNQTILLIEHDMKVVMGICERIIVLDSGKLIANGMPEEIRNNPQVIAAYLGEPEQGGFSS